MRHCTVPGCGREAAHPVHHEMCGRHGALVHNFMLWVQYGRFDEDRARLTNAGDVPA